MVSQQKKTEAFPPRNLWTIFCDTEISFILFDGFWVGHLEKTGSLFLFHARFHPSDDF